METETIYQNPIFADIISRQEAIMSHNTKTPPNNINKQYHASWLFSIPPDSLRNKKILLLTIMGIAVQAVWNGPLGTYYSAYDASEHDSTKN